MAITATQKRILNEASRSMPELRKGQLGSADEINLGDLFEQIQLAEIASPDVGTVAALTATAIAAADATVTSTAIAAADAVAATGGDAPTETEHNQVVTLANELKLDFTAARVDIAATETLANELKLDYTALLADVTALRTRITEVKLLLEEIKDAINAGQA